MPTFLKAKNISMYCIKEQRNGTTPHIKKQGTPNIYR